MPNMQAIITSHNKAVLAKTNKSESTTTQEKNMQLPKEEKLPIVQEMPDGERRVPGLGNKRRQIGDRDVRCRTNRGTL